MSKGVRADRICIHGYGTQHPVASNATEESRRQNRRFEVVISDQDGAIKDRTGSNKKENFKFKSGRIVIRSGHPARQGVPFWVCDTENGAEKPENFARNSPCVLYNSDFLKLCRTPIRYLLSKPEIKSYPTRGFTD